MKGNQRVLLIQPQFAPLYMPSCALGRLKAYLRVKNIMCDCCYLNLDLAAYLNEELRIFAIQYSDSSGERSLIEFLYSAELYPEYIPERLFLNKIISVHKRPIDKPEMCLNLLKGVHEFDSNLMSRWMKYFPYTVVGISANYNLMPALYLCAMLKRLHPHVQVVLGGSMCVGEVGYSMAKAFPFLDWVVDGEGEEPLYEITRAIESGSDDVPAGVSRRMSKGVICNTNFRKPLDLGHLPVPDYDDYFSSKSLRKVEPYMPYTVSLPIEAGRGCWWGKCTFCNYPNLGPHLYRRIPDKCIVEGMEYLAKRHNCLSFYFTDAVQPTNLNSLAKTLIKSPHDFNFGLYLRADISVRQFELLKKAGLQGGAVGIESFSDGMLKKMNKGTTVIDNVLFLKVARELGEVTTFNIISPYPGETYKERTENYHNISKISHLISGAVRQVSFSLKYGSSYYCNPKKYGIRIITSSPIYEQFLPRRYRFKPTLFLSYLPKIRTRKIVPESILNGEDGGSLELHVSGKGYCVIKDRRTTSKRWFDYLLTPPHSDVLVMCMLPQKRDRLKCESSVLRDLIKTGLLIESRGMYLTLATRNNSK